MDISKPRFVFLPQDREIMQICGIDEKQYKAFMLQCYRASITRPAEEPTAFLNFLIPIVIGIALSFAAQLLLPKPKEPDRTEEKRTGGQNYVTGQRSAPTSGFDTVQNVVEVGSTIPLVYANRRQVGGIYYGGVRVNLNLLFSQLYSVGGGQLLRAIFAVSEGTLPQPEVSQYAIGNNLLNNYDLAQSSNSRLSLYYVSGTRSNNRIVSGDHIAGRLPASDIGNAQSADPPGADVFQTRKGTSWGSDFCFVETPSNQTTFGVSGFIGNNMPFRINPTFKPARAYNGTSVVDYDAQTIAERLKQNKRYSGRSGVYQIYDYSTGTTYNDVNDPRNVDINDIVYYKIWETSCAKSKHFIIKEGTGESYCADVAASVASRQNSFDDAIVLGDKYLIGTAQGICTFRTAEPFESEVANNPPSDGTPVEVQFTITAPGIIQQWPDSDLNPAASPNVEPVGHQPSSVTATSSSHIMRMAEGYFAIERASRYVEVGLRSNVSLNINGICNFRDIATGDVNNDGSRQSKDYNLIDKDRFDDNRFFTNSTITTPETRYSFFRVSVREIGTTNYRIIPKIFAIRSMMSSSVYNYISFDLGAEKLWEFKFTPVSAYEVRYENLPVTALDYKLNNRVSNDYFTSDTYPIKVYYTGTSVSVSEPNFSFYGLTTADGTSVGVMSDGSDLEFDQDLFYGEKYAKIAEYFMFNEITSSATSPEHEIVYVNCQTSNPIEPEYDNIAMVGLNIRSSKEIKALQQFSVYCNQGIGSTNKFPEILLDLMTNTRYGTGKILNAAQIDTTSFTEAANWCEDRHYFFDGIIDSKINIRSWATTVAKNFLLDLVIRNGKFALEPVCNFDSAVTVSALFSAGNILTETFEFNYSDEADRIPPRVSVKWREERQNNSSGMFPVVKQVTVRESTTSDDAPLETIDLTDYCTSEKQAIDVGKYNCRIRRLITHSVSFETTPTQAALNIGAIFKLGMETVAYEQPQNGAIASDGTVTSWPPLADGNYAVLLWDGITNRIQDVTITVTNGKTTQTNAVFCLKTGTTSAETYKTQALSYTDDGNIRCEATIYPINGDGHSLITDGWDTAGNWIIDGAST